MRLKNDTDTICFSTTLYSVIFNEATTLSTTWFSFNVVMMNTYDLIKNDKAMQSQNNCLVRLNVVNDMAGRKLAS